MENNESPAKNLEILEKDLLQRLSARGGHAGNLTLQRDLGWKEEEYWAIRDRLVDSGQLQLGRGKGGSVSLIVSLAQESPEQPILQSSLAAIAAEEDLYTPVSEVLRKEWARDMRFRSHIVEVTARQGRKDTGGVWTRPDIVVAALRVFPHVHGKFFDLITFEIKPLAGIDVTAVFEALSHRRAATQAYVWLHVPSSAADSDNMAAALERVREEARRHGIGLMVASDPRDYASWDIQIRASRLEPDPESLNEFIAQQLKPLSRDELAQWFR